MQRYRCEGCQRTWSGRTGSAIRGIHRPDLFLAAARDMLGDRKPLSVRKLAGRLGLDKHTVWRWRMLIQRALSGASDAAFVGVVEADEAFQRESRKGSREWVRHFRDPRAWPAPPRRRWHEYRHRGVLTMRGLSRWQLPILTLTDRSGARRLERIPDRRDSTICQTLRQVMAADAVLCSDGLSGYAAYARQHRIDHFVVGSKPGTRMASPTHHIQNANALHARLKGFIAPFRGPASRYLDGYLQWFIARDRGVDPVAVLRAL
ncbi:MAG: IS1595 family transposase [Proteobacteria bacterium]|nr:IS1595 family transposase [Pseudomonadota bacterium]